MVYTRNNVVHSKAVVLLLLIYCLLLLPLFIATTIVCEVLCSVPVFLVLQSS